MHLNAAIEGSKHTSSLGNDLRISAEVGLDFRCT